MFDMLLDYQEKTLAKYEKFSELFMNPSTTNVANMAGISRVQLANFLNRRALLSDPAIKKLNIFLDNKLGLIKDEQLQDLNKELECV